MICHVPYAVQLVLSAKQLAAPKAAPCPQVAELGPDISAVLEGITALDAIAARAGHASWTGAVCPGFVDEEAAAQHGPVLVPAMLHPLLLQVHQCFVRVLARLFSCVCSPWP